MKRAESQFELTYQERDISSFEVWRLVSRRKRTFLGIFLVSLGLGAVLLWMVPRRYQYTTALEVGSLAVPGAIDKVLVDTPATVVAKANNAFVPLVLLEYAAKHPDLENIENFQIDVWNPRDSSLVVLSSEGTEDAGEIHIALQKEIAGRLVEDQNKAWELYRENLRQKKADEAKRLEQLKDEANALAHERDMLDKTRSLLVEEIAQLRGYIEEARAKRPMLDRSAANEQATISLLMLNNELQDYRMRLAEMEQNLYLGLPLRRERIENTLVDNVREQQRQEDAIQEIDALIANSARTRVVVPSMRSMKPIGMRRTIAFAIVAAAALALGVVGALVTDHFARASVAEPPPATVEPERLSVRGS